MSEFIDQFPTLSQGVDIGGDRYFMGAQKSIELGFKSRQNYINSFTNDVQTEYLIRKYLYLSLIDKRKLTFDPPEEKAALIAILKTRADNLKSSTEFTSSTLKNTIIQRSYLNIKKLIQQLEGPEYKGIISRTGLSLPCTKAKKYVREIPENSLFQLMLELSWYLLHPDAVPDKVKCDWASIIQKLNTLRIDDIVEKIKIADTKGITADESPFNYFKRINLSSVAKAPSLKNALDQVQEMALHIQGDNANTDMKERLKILMSVLEMKKYLNKDEPIDATTSKKLSNSIISNPSRPIKGGGAKALDIQLGIAMKPFFDYFRVVFDPIYNIIESSIDEYSKNVHEKHEKHEKVMIPQLTTILHICNNIKPSETVTGGGNTYGVYRIANVDSEVIQFINTILGSTHTYVSKFSDKTKKELFNKQLFHLPKVRLTSLLNKFGNTDTYLDPDLIPYIQFFTIGGNMSLLPKDSKPEITEQVFNAINKFFNPNDLYILCTKTDNIKENIPMNMYQIDYDSIDVGDNGFKIDNISDNYFNMNKTPELYLEKLVKIEEYVVLNDAEIALSILILFKDLMPN